MSTLVLYTYEIYRVFVAGTSVTLFWRTLTHFIDGDVINVGGDDYKNSNLALSAN